MIGGYTHLMYKLTLYEFKKRRGAFGAPSLFNLLGRLFHSHFCRDSPITLVKGQIGKALGLELFVTLLNFEVQTLLFRFVGGHEDEIEHGGPNVDDFHQRLGRLLVADVKQNVAGLQLLQLLNSFSPQKSLAAAAFFVATIVAFVHDFSLLWCCCCYSLVMYN